MNVFREDGEALEHLDRRDLVTLAHAALSAASERLAPSGAAKELRSFADLLGSWLTATSDHERDTIAARGRSLARNLPHGPTAAAHAGWKIDVSHRAAECAVETMWGSATAHYAARTIEYSFPKVPDLVGFICDRYGVGDAAAEIATTLTGDGLDVLAAIDAAQRIVA